MRADETTIAESILVVDDDADVARLLGAVLLNEGYRPVLCTDGDTALEASRKEAFGLAFVDINLPGMSGLDVATRLKEDVPGCEVVFITGSGTIDNAVQAIKIGAYDYLRKPFSMSEFILCLKRYQERKALREIIRMAEERYSDLVQSIPLLIYVLRRDLQVEFVNHACSAILGFSPEEAQSTSGWFLKSIHPENREPLRRLIGEAFEPGGAPFSIECRMIHKDGHPIQVIIKSISPSGRRGLRAERIEGIIMDITERVYLEKTLVQKEKLKTLGAISAEVAHEIRNPLVAIGGFARRLQQKHPELSEVAIILKESRRLEKILDRIRNYLRPVEFHWGDCPLNDTLRECLELLAPEIERLGIVCLLQLDQVQPVAYGDMDILRQIFINLIKNALDAMASGQTLTIRSYESEKTMHVDFRNASKKVKIKKRDTLFLPFDEGGETIGLPLCYRLLKNMGGLLSFAEDGSEVVFTVSLPKEPWKAA